MALTEDDREVARLHDDMAAAGLSPLWTARDDLMPFRPQPRTLPHMWRWSDVCPLARRAGELVPVGRGGERRALAFANPGLRGEPFATQTLWAAIQYLGPHESAPEHRHSQNAFRFVVEGEGVWTVVDGDPVAMTSGDLLITAGGRFHGHHNTRDAPMAWLDGLDIPLQCALESTFFEFGDEEIKDRRTTARSESELLWGHPGVRPAGLRGPGSGSALAAYRWADTSAALDDQLEVARTGRVPGLLPGHAAVRYSDPATGGDVLNTIRAEMHRVLPGASAVLAPAVGSSVWQVFSGAALVRIGAGASAPVEHQVLKGDVFVVPSWSELSVVAPAGVDLFSFSDAPVMEKLGLAVPMESRQQ